MLRAAFSHSCEKREGAIPQQRQRRSFLCPPATLPRHRRRSMRLKAAVWVLPALMALASPAMAAPFDVTIGATVTATGAIGNSTNGAWADPPAAALSTITDGLYVPEGTDWQTGTVWWNENPNAAGAPSPALDNIIEIDLNGLFLIDFLSIQADNNDSYAIYVRDQ